MTKLAALALASLALPTDAFAAHTRLTLARAESAMRASAALDRPRAVTIAGCARISGTQIVCTVREAGARTSIADNGEYIVGDLTWEVEAVLAHGRVDAR